jgi:2-(3-amino-3-carboxypropyl)histidine synthase
MKTMFIEAARKFDNIDFKELEGIKSSKIGLIASLQYISIIYSVKKFLEKKGKKVFLAKSKGRLKYPGQILGCDVSAALAVRDKADIFLLIGSGKFHALNVASLGKPVLVWQPGSKPFMLPKEEIERMEARKKAGISKFLMAHKIGIIVSTKYGQEKLSWALKMKEKLEKKGKKVFIFIADMISKNDLENFSVDVWINTACPNLILDLPNTVNMNHIENYL